MQMKSRGFLATPNSGMVALEEGHVCALVPAPWTNRPKVGTLSRSQLKPQRRVTCGATEGSGDKPDFIERAFGALFGNKALGASEPFGMKRMSDEAYNEQSVATTTEFAEPVGGDSEEVARFRPLLARTRLEKLPLRCIPDTQQRPAVLHIRHTYCVGMQPPTVSRCLCVPA